MNEQSYSLKRTRSWLPAGIRSRAWSRRLNRHRLSGTALLGHHFPGPSQGQGRASHGRRKASSFGRPQCALSPIPAETRWREINHLGRVGPHFSARKVGSRFFCRQDCGAPVNQVYTQQCQVLVALPRKRGSSFKANPLMQLPPRMIAEIGNHPIRGKMRACPNLALRGVRSHHYLKRVDYLSL